MPSLKQKSLVFVVVLVLLFVSVISFAVLHNEDGSETVSFLLTDQYGNKTTHEDLSEKPLLVFFGFTNCVDICPIGMTQLSSILSELSRGGYDNSITPVFISVDPERDTVERVADFLDRFEHDFVGLTGSRTALQNVAAEFNTFLDNPPEQHSKAGDSHDKPSSSEHTSHGTHAMHSSHDAHHSTENFIENYQLRHSSVVYLVDRYSRVVDYISLDEDIDSIVNRLREYLIQAGPFGA